jgi:undecaprenyl-diphosphatase
MLTALHLGTTIAILIGYRDFFFKDLLSSRKLRTLLYIAIATIPAALLGVLLESAIQQTLHSNYIVILMLILVGAAMVWIENSGYGRRPTITRWEDISWWQALIIGLGQSLALIPGTSRSGASTITAMLLGVEKFKAIEYSFILGAPILLGSFLYAMYSTPGSLETVLTTPVVVGIVISGLVGFIAIQILKRFSKSKFLTFFGVYRIVLGTLLLLILA